MSSTEVTVVEPTRVLARTHFLDLSLSDRVAATAAIATTLKDIIKQQKLAIKLGNGEHVLVEAWLALGKFAGIMPREKESFCHENGTWESHVELVRVDNGAIVGHGSSICGLDEPNWKSKPNVARRSMSITRATGKAFRNGLADIMVMAGYKPTPAEEMPDYVPPQKPQPNSNKHEGNAQQSKKTESPPEASGGGYDPNNEKMQKWMMQKLADYKVPSDKWDDVAKAMIGKGADKLKATIAQITGAQ